MARQRSRSSGARQSKGPRAGKPGTAKPGAKRPAKATGGGSTATTQPPAAAPPPAEPTTAEPAARAAEPAEPTTAEPAELTTAEPAPARPEPATAKVDRREAPEPPVDALRRDDERDLEEFREDAPGDAEPGDLLELEEEETDPVASYEAVDLDETDEIAERSATTEALWAEVRIAPVEIALPKGVGYTLRAYRMTDELAPVEIDEREDEYAALHRRPTPEDDVEEADEFEEPEEVDELEEAEAEPSDDDAAEEPEDEADVEPVVEEVPVFLARRGTLYLFRSPEGLVEFVRTSEDHDLVQLDTWEQLRARITPADIVPEEDDSYELDLVVDNLRGGADAVDARLLIRAGEVARDLAYALRLEPVLAALAAESPLDDLDEALRTAESGGLRGFIARRKLRKIVTQQAALGWRTIVGKISGVVDWRN